MGYCLPKLAKGWLTARRLLKRFVSLLLASLAASELMGLPSLRCGHLLRQVLAIALRPVAEAQTGSKNTTSTSGLGYRPRVGYRRHPLKWIVALLAPKGYGLC